MTEKEMKLLHERMKKEDPRLLVLMEKCFDAGVMSGKEQAQRTWVGLTDEEVHALWMTGEANISEEHHRVVAYEVEAKLREKNT